MKVLFIIPFLVSISGCNFTEIANADNSCQDMGRGIEKCLINDGTYCYKTAQGGLWCR